MKRLGFVAIAFMMFSAATHATLGKALHFKVTYIEAKNDHTGSDKRIDAALLKRFEGVFPFDSYVWAGAKSIDIPIGGHASVAIPTSESSYYIEYQKDEGTQHVFLFGPKDKSGTLKRSQIVKLPDGGIFLQGATTKGGKNFIISFNIKKA